MKSSWRLCENILVLLVCISISISVLHPFLHLSLPIHLWNAPEFSLRFVVHIYQQLNTFSQKEKICSAKRRTVKIVQKKIYLRKVGRRKICLRKVWKKKNSPQKSVEEESMKPSLQCCPLPLNRGGQVSNPASAFYSCSLSSSLSSTPSSLPQERNEKMSPKQTSNPPKSF